MYAPGRKRENAAEKYEIEQNGLAKTSRIGKRAKVVGHKLTSKIVHESNAHVPVPSSDDAHRPWTCSKLNKEHSTSMAGNSPGLSTSARIGLKHRAVRAVKTGSPPTEVSQKDYESFGMKRAEERVFEVDPVNGKNRFFSDRRKEFQVVMADLRSKTGASRRLVHRDDISEHSHSTVTPTSVDLAIAASSNPNSPFQNLDFFNSPERRKPQVSGKTHSDLPHLRNRPQWLPNTIRFPAEGVEKRKSSAVPVQSPVRISDENDVVQRSRSQHESDELAAHSSKKLGRAMRSLRRKTVTNSAVLPLRTTTSEMLHMRTSSASDGSDSSSNLLPSRLTTMMMREIERLNKELETASETLAQVQARACKNEAVLNTEMCRLHVLFASLDRAQELRFRSLMQVFSENFETIGLVESKFDIVMSMTEKARRASAGGRIARVLWFTADYACSALIAVLQFGTAAYSRIRSEARPNSSRSDEGQGLVSL